MMTGVPDEGSLTGHGGLLGSSPAPRSDGQMSTKSSAFT